MAEIMPHDEDFSPLSSSLREVFHMPCCSSHISRKEDREEDVVLHPSSSKKHYRQFSIDPATVIDSCTQQKHT